MNNKKLKRREEKEGNNIKKDPKALQKRKNRKKLVPKGSAKLRRAGRGQGISYFIASVVPWKEKSP
jgi:hypothetical protein